VVCPFCEEEFTSLWKEKYHIRRHALLHCPADRKSHFPCPHCQGVVFDTLKKRNNHLGTHVRVYNILGRQEHIDTFELNIRLALTFVCTSAYKQKARVEFSVKKCQCFLATRYTILPTHLKVNSNEHGSTSHL